MPVFRAGLLALALSGCGPPAPAQLFIADCRDGTRFSGTREIVESRCIRRGGIGALTALDPTATPQSGR